MQPTQTQNGKAGSWTALPKGFFIEGRSAGARTIRYVRPVANRWVNSGELADAYAYVNAQERKRGIEEFKLKNQIKDLQAKLDAVQQANRFDLGLSLEHSVDNEMGYEMFAAVRLCSKHDGVEYMDKAGNLIMKWNEDGTPQRVRPEEHDVE